MNFLVGRRLLGIVVGLVALLGASRAEATFELGGRTGYAFPMGDAIDDGELDDVVAGQIPLWFDIGARVSGKTFLGGYLQYGFGFPSDQFEQACDDAEEEAEALGGDRSCRLYVLRLGFEALFHFGQDGPNDPWLGIGTGYELFAVVQSQEIGGQEADLTLGFHGFELLNFQAGIDFPMGPKAAIGPFLALSLAQYQTASVSCSGDCGDLDDDSEEIEDKGIHEWFFVGIRATFLP